MATKFIVRLTNAVIPDQNGMYWCAEGWGLTFLKDQAYKYTRDELKVHSDARAIKDRCVLIPVQVDEE